MPLRPSSRLHFSKIPETSMEEEGTPITTKPRQRSDESIESNIQIDGVDGSTGGNRQSFDVVVVEETKNNDRSIGILVLLTVPLAWGTYTPVVKYMYEKMDPSMPGFVFSAGYYLVAAASLGILTRLQDDNGRENDGEGGVDRLNGRDETNDEGADDCDDASVTARGGWELGSYLFVGNGLQVVGLQTVPADRAAFLVQLTTVMVPLLSALSEGKLSAVPLPTWFACIIAFAGVIIMGADDGGLSSNVSDGSETIDSVLASGVGENSRTQLFELVDMNQLSLSQGDILIVCAAVAYTMHVVRLGAYAPQTTPLKLAASKASTEAFLSVLLVIGLAFIGSTHFPSPEFVGQTGSEVLGYFKTIASAFAEGGPALDEREGSIGVSVGAILWTGWVTCAYTIYAQSFGQRRVNPTDSNLIYTTQPLFSSAFAYVLLGETLGVFGYVGAALIGTALYLASSTEKED